MERRLIPPVERRLQGLIEVRRRAGETRLPGESGPLTVTISREFGCEGYPTAESLQSLLAEATGAPWALMDKALLEAASADPNLSERVLRTLGDRSPFIDNLIGALSPRWRTQGDTYALLARQIVTLARDGNVILVGRGGAALTQSLENCVHFRLVAPLAYRIRSISKRLELSRSDAEALVLEKQEQREAFLRSFLACDLSDPTLYHLVLNNARASAAQMAQAIVSYLRLTKRLDPRSPLQLEDGADE